MDISKTTQKVQEALQQAQVKALRYGHQEVDADHVLFALLDQEGGLVSRLVESIGASVPVIRARIEQELENRPRVEGSSEAGKVYITQQLNRMLVKAGDEAKRLKDEYISVEHGVPVDYFISNVTSDSQLIDAINQVRNENN